MHTRQAAGRRHGALSVDQPAPRHAGDRAARASPRSSGSRAWSATTAGARCCSTWTRRSSGWRADVAGSSVHRAADRRLPQPAAAMGGALSNGCIRHSIMKLRSVSSGLISSPASSPASVILVMSVTGTLLTFQQSVLQIIDAIAALRVAAAGGGPARRRRAAGAGPRSRFPMPQPTTVTLDSDPRAAAAVALGTQGTLFVESLHRRRARHRVGAGARRSIVRSRAGTGSSPSRGSTAPPRGRSPARATPRFSCSPSPASISGGRGSGLARTSLRVTLVPPRSARQGSRLQLAQRDRFLVRAGAHRPDHDRHGHLLSLGEQPRLHADRQSAAGGPAGRGGGPGAAVRLPRASAAVAADAW